MTISTISEISSDKPGSNWTCLVYGLAGAIIGAGITYLVLSSQPESTNCIENPSCTNPFQNIDTITLEQAKELQNKYHEYADNAVYRDLSGNTITMDETNHTWFSLEKINNLIAHACYLKNCNNIEISGFRIYFGRYSDNFSGLISNGATALSETNRLTLFISPTVEQTNGTSDANDPDLGFGIMNYGHMGQPPKKIIE
jgi:hypothetical protein